ncbi:MAG: penicillin-binding transpeptidase domain-containing protein [Spongiibacteraceae bacterium]
MSKTAAKAVALPRWRLRAVVLLLAALLLMLIWRLLELQVLDRERGYEFLQDRADMQSVRIEEIPAHRGQILDRNGQPLAVSTPLVSIWANPSEVTPKDADSKQAKKALAARAQWSELARLLGTRQSELEKRLMMRGKKFLYLRRHMPPSEAEAVLALKIPGVYGKREFRRFYPAGEVTAHLLGFTDVDDHGQEGLELAYDQWMSGTPGSKKVLKGLNGKTIREIDAGKAAQPGRDLVLSIDLRLQYLAHRELRAQLQASGAEAGSVVLLDTQTGEVLAMANQPSFNPNNRQLKPRDIRNRAMTDLIEPGSTMKALSLVAALESGKYTPHTPVDASPGWLRVDGKTLKDPVNFGALDVTRVLTKSSQIGMTRIALSLSEKNLVDVASRFGMGAGTETGFPGEVHGLLPVRNRWSDIERANFAFGYGLQVTPLQLARAYSVFAADGCRRAVSLLRRDEPGKCEQVISPLIAGELTDMLKTVIGPEGTGKRAGIPAYSVAGKTGTAHKVGAQGYEDRYRAIFAGFAPADNPRVAAVIVIDDPLDGRYHGGEAAAPVFGKVVGGAMRVLNIAPDQQLPAVLPPPVAKTAVTAEAAPAAKKTILRNDGRGPV